MRFTTKTIYIHTFHNRNLISLKMQTTNNKIINIHNMYNSCKKNENNNTLFNFKKTLQKKLKKKTHRRKKFQFTLFQLKRTTCKNKRRRI